MTEHIKQIPPPEITRALVNSGYLIESRVCGVLADRGWRPTLNHLYKKTAVDSKAEYGEIDVLGVQLYVLRKQQVKKTYLVAIHLYCECKNNSQPIVFIEPRNKRPIGGHFGHTGNIKVLDSQGHWNGLRAFIHSKISTQYCTFQAKGNGWLACQNPELHKSLEGIGHAIKYFSSSLEDRNIRIDIHIPVAIFQGDLYKFYVDRNNRLIKINEACLRKEYFSKSSSEETMYINVVTEGYLKTYLNKLEKHFDKCVCVPGFATEKIGISPRKRVFKFRVTT